MSNIEVVTPARDEAENLEPVLTVLFNQTLPPKRVIVVDDNSADATRSIAHKFGCQVVSLSDHSTRRELGTPDLADVYNAGLSCVSDSADYVMILGADHILPHDYIASIVSFMEKESLTLASGIIDGETSIVPRGSGRIVRADVWRNAMGSIRYPRNFGFETYLVLKLESLGFKSSVLDIGSRTLRRTGSTVKQTNYGRGMKWLGYTLKYMLGRALVTTIRYRNPIKGIQMIYGYVTYSEKSDVASYLSKQQNELLLSYLRSPRKLYRRIIGIST